ncbi:hypothetical protein TEQG_05117 [Trichophyton equinum CBS 127.97]|uniref:Uncharacterized protein n=1 Tax=Trichophyton equinum (strain ATCC MYA-4606 / CBS 127.97) TaxID=559882 RepID=F2PWF3_TRIEC|nr:hypothetical protein TEQG_05117 [Trichophyton equinum CBS 127.97]
MVKKKQQQKKKRERRICFRRAVVVMMVVVVVVVENEVVGVEVVGWKKARRGRLGRATQEEVRPGETKRYMKDGSVYRYMQKFLGCCMQISVATGSFPGKFLYYGTREEEKDIRRNVPV